MKAPDTVELVVRETHQDLEKVMVLSAECFPLLDRGHPVRALLGEIRAIVRGCQERLAELA